MDWGSRGGAESASETAGDVQRKHCGRCHEACESWTPGATESYERHPGNSGFPNCSRPPACPGPLPAGPFLGDHPRPGAYGLVGRRGGAYPWWGLSRVLVRPAAGGLRGVFAHSRVSVRAVFAVLIPELVRELVPNWFGAGTEAVRRGSVLLPTVPPPRRGGPSAYRPRSLNRLQVAGIRPHQPGAAGRNPSHICPSRAGEGPSRASQVSWLCSWLPPARRRTEMPSRVRTGLSQAGVALVIGRPAPLPDSRVLEGTGGNERERRRSAALPRRPSLRRSCSDCTRLALQKRDPPPTRSCGARASARGPSVRPPGPRRSWGSRVAVGWAGIATGSAAGPLGRSAPVRELVREPVRDDPGAVRGTVSATGPAGIGLSLAARPGRRHLGGGGRQEGTVRQWARAGGGSRTVGEA